MRCEQCGEELIEGAQFCGECGTRVAPAPPPNAVADTEFARGDDSDEARGAQGNTKADADASRGPKTAPMTETPELPSPGVAKTDPMAGVPMPQHSPVNPLNPGGKPATTLPWQEPKRKSRRGLIAALLLLASASLAGLLFAASGGLPLKWPLSRSQTETLPPLVLTPPAPSVETPERIDPLVPDPVPLPPAAAPARPPVSPPSRPPAAPATPPAAPPTVPTTPPPLPTLPPGVPPALPPTTSPAPTPTPPAPAPGLPTLPGIPLPWANATAGACERCIAELRNGGHYAVPLAAAQHLLCEDPAARESCAAEIREASPALAERAARDGDCAAAWATKTAALNLGVGNDRFQTVDALCR